MSGGFTNHRGFAIGPQSAVPAAARRRSSWERRPRRGVATFIAISILAIVAVALTAIGNRMRADYLRTQNAAADAQLRQLLLAGAADASHRAAAWGEGPESSQWALDLPQPLVADGASVRATAAATAAAGANADTKPDAPPASAPADAAPAVEVHISAECYGRRTGQTLRFERRGAAWQLARAVADGPATAAR